VLVEDLTDRVVVSRLDPVQRGACQVQDGVQGADHTGVPVPCAAVLGSEREVGVALASDVEEQQPVGHEVREGVTDGERVGCDHALSVDRQGAHASVGGHVVVVAAHVAAQVDHLDVAGPLSEEPAVDVDRAFLVDGERVDQCYGEGSRTAHPGSVGDVGEGRQLESVGPSMAGQRRPGEGVVHAVDRVRRAGLLESRADGAVEGARE